MDMRQALERLCTCTAPSGFEAPAAAVAAELLRPLVDEVSVDRMGNVLGVRRCGKEGAPRLLLDAHLDEIGLLVTGVEDGFLRFRSIGGVDPRMLPGRELVVLTDPPRRGIVTCPAGGEADKSIPLSELFVDVGLSQTEAERAVPVGTPMVYRGGCFALGEDQMCGKSMDDRSCFVTLLRAAELLKDKPLDVDLYIMGSTREEVSGAGAKVGTYGINPDFCVAVDVTHGKTPDGPREKSFEVGGGPVIGGPQIGIGPNMTRWMTQRMIEKAKANAIPYQPEVMEGHTGTNGWGMQVTREGVATSVVSLPLKYMHSPIEVLDIQDIEHVAALLAAFTENLGKEVGKLC